MKVMLVLLKNSTDALEVLNKLLRLQAIFFLFKFASSANAYGATVSQAINKQISEM